MKKAALGLIAIAAAIGTPALAADMALKAPPPPSTPSWTGWYFGVDGGGEWGTSSTSSPLTNATCGICYIPSVVTNINSVSAQTVTSSGGSVGIEGGYNFQINPTAVVGVEADFGYFGLSGNQSTSAAFTGFPVPAGGVAPTYTNSISTDWLFTMRGRLGFLATPNLLVFGTGGIAVTDLHYAHTFVEGVFPGTSSGTEAASVTQGATGYAVGGGLEYRATTNWSLKAEYLYLGFGNISTGPSPVIFPGPTTGGSVFNHSANLSASIFRMGLNYQFGAPPIMANH